MAKRISAETKQKIRDLRFASHLTYKAVAKEAGVSVHTARVVCRKRVRFNRKGIVLQVPPVTAVKQPTQAATMKALLAHAVSSINLAQSMLGS
jgi:transposase-like protein